MSSIKTSVADYLTQIENLTNTNLQILKTLNDSFYTKKNHLYAEVDDTTYVIPSFLSLENKINMLQENFENLVKSPETSEAYFNFDGNTRAIEVRKYSHEPDSITLPIVNTYSVDSNDIFKDFMTPIPHINFDLPSLPNDIVEVNVKKIIPKNSILEELFINALSYKDKDKNGKEFTNYHTSVNYKYSDVYKLLLNYEEDIDYIEYDTIYKLPIRKSIGKATYVIEEVISDVIDDDLNEIITLKLRSNLTNTNKFTNTLTYKLFDETIERPLKIGDELINYDGTGKVVITEIRPLTNTIVVKVVNGEYLNFLGTIVYDTNNDTDIHDFSKLRFYSPINFDSDKYIKIPLEEDKYVFIAIAPLNSRMNIQSSWGTGIILNTHSLVNLNTMVPFNTYYNTNVMNIGDALQEITALMAAPITKLSKEDFEKITKFKPVIDKNNLKVVQINNHLNNSDTVQNIRDAYDQKKNAETELKEIQTKIIDLNKTLSSISFEDTTGMRSMYSSQLTKLNEKQNELQIVINNAINTININSNSAEIPIKNAKYRIRGFHVPKDYKENVIGLNVQYRYKNTSKDTGNATSISGENGQTYIYSDWNELNTTNKQRVAKYENGLYAYSYESSNENINEPSYNQIDIPISQGESVDIRLQLIYDFGQPYISVKSDWSDIINVKFPNELVSDVTISKIIEENNGDIESNRFNNILNNTGVSSHINDSLTDQSITYFHGPDKIASGFYTEERRIIPLKDKLLSLSNDISEIKNTVLGINGICKVTANIGNSSTPLYSDRTNSITLAPYDTIAGQNNSTVGSYNIKNGIVYTTINLHITNTGTGTLKLYSLFPGNRDIYINNTKASLYDNKNYCESSESENPAGVWFKIGDGLEKNLQTLNQFITFRVNNPYTGQRYYELNADPTSENLQCSKELKTLNGTTTTSVKGMALYPRVLSKYGLCIDSDETISYLSINPGEDVIIPLECEYIVDVKYGSIKKTISFDLRTSLYTDPINYTLEVNCLNSTTYLDDFVITTDNSNNEFKDVKNYSVTV